MCTITTRDGKTLYYKDWGPGRKRGPAVVFSHGWVRDAWESQMLYLGAQGYRCIAHHRRSNEAWNRDEVDTYADDLAELVDKLNLRDATFVGQSTGGAEIARYIGRHGGERVAKVVLMGAVTPYRLEPQGNQGDAPADALDALHVPAEAFWMLGIRGGPADALDCIHTFCPADFTEAVRELHLPALPASDPSAKRTGGAVLKLYAHRPQDVAYAHKDPLNTDLLAFLRS